MKPRRTPAEEGEAACARIQLGRMVDWSKVG
jgi:hypothetical protein